jgi:hypothetical protein
MRLVAGAARLSFTSEFIAQDVPPLLTSKLALPRAAVIAREAAASAEVLKRAASNALLPSLKFVAEDHAAAGVARTTAAKLADWPADVGPLRPQSVVLEAT